MPSVRFHLDEHVSHAIARGLRMRGIDVTTSTEVGLLGADDPAQMEFAYREVRVIYTEDADFLRLVDQQVPHAGIVFCARGSRSVGEIVRFLELVHYVFDSEGMIGRIEYA